MRNDVPQGHSSAIAPHSQAPSDNFRRRNGPEPVRQRESVRRPANHGAASDARFAYRFTHEVQIDRVGRGGALGPLRLEQLETAAGIINEIHFPRAVAPEVKAARAARATRAMAKLREHEGFPYRAGHGRLPEHWLRPDVE